MLRYQVLRGIRVASGYYATGQTVQPTLDEANCLLACARVVELPAGSKEEDEDEDE